MVLLLSFYKVYQHL